MGAWGATESFNMPYDPRLDKFIDYFDLTVLASYRAEPDKYEISTDHFEGELDITEQFLKRLNDEEYLKERVGVRFGYRTLKNGELKIAAFLPDFNSCGAAHTDRWIAFRVQDAE